jgi:hypothetical protein
LAVGTRLNIVGGNGFFGEENTFSFDDEVRAAVGAVVTQRNESLRGVNVDAVFFVGEGRLAGPARRED